MSFTSQMDQWVAKTKSNMGAIRQGVDEKMLGSIVEGSPITGAPGQPEKSGKLKTSWRQEKDETQTVTSSDVPYARAVEENWGNAEYHSGGPYSVALTVAGFPSIVKAVADEVSGD